MRKVMFWAVMVWSLAALGLYGWAVLAVSCALVHGFIWALLSLRVDGLCHVCGRRYGVGTLGMCGSCARDTRVLR